MFRTIFFALLGCCTVAAHAADADSHFEKLDQAIQLAKEKTQMAAGTAYIVVRGDEIIHEGYFGYADVESKKPVTDDTLFYIASTTKAFFSAATLLAEERGDLSESTTLAQLFPGTRFTEVDANTITVKHLLTHTHGLENKHMTWAGSYTGLHNSALRKTMLAATHKDPSSAIGEFNYSNLGYNIMSIWFEDFYGQDWRTTLKDTLLTPLGMNTSSAFMSDARHSGWMVAKPYTYKKDRGQTAIYLQKDDQTMFAIGMISTVRDIANFLKAELNGGLVDGVQALPKAVVAKSQVQQVAADGPYYDGYAWGWLTGKYGEFRKTFHTGGFAGASALISYIPEAGIGLAVLHNEGGLRANYLNGLIEDGAYGAMMQKAPEAQEAELAATIESMSVAYQKATARLDKKRADLASRKLAFSHPIAAYTGRYTHPLSGTITVQQSPASGLSFIWGNLRGAAYPDEANAVLVELRPGSFDKFEFKANQSGVESLVFDDIIFSRKPFSE